MSSTNLILLGLLLIAFSIYQPSEKIVRQTEKASAFDNVIALKKQSSLQGPSVIIPSNQWRVVKDRTTEIFFCEGTYRLRNQCRVVVNKFIGTTKLVSDQPLEKYLVEKLKVKSKITRLEKDSSGDLKVWLSVQFQMQTKNLAAGRIEI